MDVLWERYVQRETERHWVHKTINQSRERFINGGIKAGFGDFFMGRTIKIDATDFSKLNYNELITVAKNFILAKGIDKMNGSGIETKNL